MSLNRDCTVFRKKQIRSTIQNVHKTVVFITCSQLGSLQWSIGK